MSHPSLRPLPVLVVWLVLAARGAPMSVQGDDFSIDTKSLLDGLTGAADAFVWAPRGADEVRVALPRIGQAGWERHDSGLRLRSVPSFTGDPTYEAVFNYPSPDREVLGRLLFQVPEGFAKRPFEERMVVVALHGMRGTEKEMFLGTDLPFLCAERGWALAAPFLPRDRLGNPKKRGELRAALAQLHPALPFDFRRLYLVGFSLGAVEAIDFAVENRDGAGVEVLGVLAHTSTSDWPERRTNQDPFLELFLRARRGRTVVDPESPGAPARRPLPAAGDELAGMTIFLHGNVADPTIDPVRREAEMVDWLRARGARVYDHLVFEPVGGHTWRSLPLEEGFRALMAWDASEITVEASERFDQVRGIAFGARPSYDLDLALPSAETTNSFSVLRSTDLLEIAFNLDAVGLRADEPLIFQCSSADKRSIAYVLSGYEREPGGVFVDEEPIETWSFIPERGEVTIQPDTRGRRGATGGERVVPRHETEHLGGDDGIGVLDPRAALRQHGARRLRAQAQERVELARAGEAPPPLARFPEQILFGGAGSVREHEDQRDARGGSHFAAAGSGRPSSTSRVRWTKGCLAAGSAPPFDR